PPRRSGETRYRAPEFRRSCLLPEPEGAAHRAPRQHRDQVALVVGAALQIVVRLERTGIGLDRARERLERRRRLESGHGPLGGRERGRAPAQPARAQAPAIALALGQRERGDADRRALEVAEGAVAGARTAWQAR